MDTSLVEIICFGVFEFRQANGELRKRGTPLRLDPQAAQLLALLLEEPGKLISYDEMRDRLWGNGTFVDYGKGIRRCLTQLRAVLGDSAKNTVYIETERGRGCRFIAPVKISGPEDEKPNIKSSSSGIPAGYLPEKQMSKPVITLGTPLDSTPAQYGSGSDLLKKEEPGHMPDVAQVTNSVERGSLAWMMRRATVPVGVLMFFVLLVAAVLSSAYGLAILLFWLGAIGMVLGFERSADLPIMTAIVAVYMIAAMSFTASTSSLPEVLGTIINLTTLPPSPAYSFTIGLKFIPLFILVLVYLVIVACRRNKGFLLNPRFGTVYVFTGILFLLSMLVCVAAISQDFRIFRAGLPGAWILLMAYVTTVVSNLAIWLAGWRFFKRELVVGHRQLLALSAVFYLPVALSAFFMDSEYNRVNKDYLDVRWPEAYVAANPNALESFHALKEGPLGPQMGPDLMGLIEDPNFNQALRSGSFYKEPFDESFQLGSRAVIFGYRPRKPLDRGQRPFVRIRFPKGLADALRFESVGEAN